MCNYTNCQIAKDGSSVWPMSNFLNTVIDTKKKKILGNDENENNKMMAFWCLNGPLT
jgi:hypothetical protein